jgi:CRISPR system Cascade subunit CasA
VDPLQVYWAMPRRIRLLAETVEMPGEAPGCDLCGEPARPAVRRYLVLNLGVNYIGPWEHPLSPHGIDAGGLPFPVKGGQAGPSYRYWLGLVQSSEELRRHPAQVVKELALRGDADCLLWAFGYDMDNMKARSWVEGTLPLLWIEPELRPELERQVAALVLGARRAERALVQAAKEAMTGRPQDLPGDPGELGARFWQETEENFFAHLRRLRRELSGETDTGPVRASWHRCLVRAATQAFEGFCGNGFVAATDPRRVALAFKGLQKNLQGPKILALEGDTHEEIHVVH